MARFSIRGWRKMIVAISICAGAVAVDLNEYQAEVLKTVAVAMLMSNAAISVGGTFAEAIRSRRPSGTGPDLDIPAGT